MSKLDPPSLSLSESVPNNAESGMTGGVSPLVLASLLPG